MLHCYIAIYYFQVRLQASQGLVSGQLDSGDTGSRATSSGQSLSEHLILLPLLGGSFGIPLPVNVQHGPSRRHAYSEEQDNDAAGGGLHFRLAHRGGGKI